MSLDARDPRLTSQLARLAPYARELLERAAQHAATLHADAVTIEHLLSALMRDHDAGAHALVLHAFADPPTIDEEALAISPGVMVVASGATLPFSTGALRALLGARALAGSGAVTPRHLLQGALAALPGAALAALRAAGLAPALVIEGVDGGALGAEPLFRRFDGEAKRALSSANREAHRAGEPSIGPARLVVASLERDAALASEAGLAWPRARSALSAWLVDDEPPAPRALSADADLLAFLARVPVRAGSSELLAEMVASGPVEVVALLARHKVGPALVARARGAFPDPEPA